MTSGGHIKLRLRFFLEMLRITYDLFESPHPPTALVVLLGLDNDDIKLRRSNPYCSLPGPKAVTLMLMLYAAVPGAPTPPAGCPSTPFSPSAPSLLWVPT